MFIMKKQFTIGMLSVTLLISGCASTGGLATSANGGCNTERTAAMGALIGAAAGFAFLMGNNNSAAIALGALPVGHYLRVCVAINAKTVQKQSATAVDKKYKQANKGSLPA